MAARACAIPSLNQLAEILRLHIQITVEPVLAFVMNQRHQHGDPSQAGSVVFSGCLTSGADAYNACARKVMSTTAKLQPEPEHSRLLTMERFRRPSDSRILGEDWSKFVPFRKFNRALTEPLFLYRSGCQFAERPSKTSKGAVNHVGRYHHHLPRLRSGIHVH